MDSDVVGFAAVAAVVTVAPAADFALVSRRAMTVGVGPAVLTASGICAGVLVWGALSALGVSALIAASAEAFTALRIAGAAYLVFLGAQALLRARRLTSGSVVAPDGGPASVPERSAAFRQGLLTNLLNPKVGVFYSAVLPQFVSRHDSVLAVSLLFAGLHAVMGMLWLSASAYVLSRGRSVFGRPRARAAIEAVTGIVLVALGLRVAGDRA